MESLRCAIWRIISLFFVIFFLLDQKSSWAENVPAPSNFTYQQERQKATTSTLNLVERKELSQELKLLAMGEKSSLPKKKSKTDPKRRDSGAKGEKFLRWRIDGNLLNRLCRDTVETDFENAYLFRSWLIKGEVDFTQHDLSAVASFGSRYDYVFDHDTDWNLDVLLLREAYVHLEKGSWALRLGRQYVTWGKLDDFTLLDIINPQYFREFILLDKQERKNPILMAKLDYYHGDYYFEGIFIPWFEPNEIDFFDSKWALFGYIRKRTLKSTTDPLVKQAMDNMRIKTYSLDASERAIRLGGRAKGVDYSFYYMSLHDRTPALEESTPMGRTLMAYLYNPTAETLANLALANPTSEDVRLLAKYARLNVVGADFETVIGEFGLRGEAGLFLKPLYLKEDFSLTRKTTISSGIGIDHTTANDLYLNLQFIGRFILNGNDLYPANQYTHQLVGIISKNFLRERVVPSFYCGYNFSDQDSFYNPEITYKPNGSLSFSIGAFIFEGDATTVFGRFDDNDLVYLTCEYKF